MATGPRRLGGAVSLLFAPFSFPAPLQLRDGTRSIQLLLSLDFEIAQPGNRREYALQPTSYVYAISDLDSRELLAFHWHPSGVSAHVSPHLHISSQLPEISLGARQPRIRLSDMHLPTGFITFADIVRLLIDEFGVEPLRDDWREVLAEDKAATLGG
jgi:hypothetical protein